MKMKDKTEYRRIENDGKGLSKTRCDEAIMFPLTFLIPSIFYSFPFFSFPFLSSLFINADILYPAFSTILDPKSSVPCLSNCPLFLFSLSPSVFYFLWFSTLSLSPSPSPSSTQYLTLNNSRLTTFFLSCLTIVFLSFSFSSSSSSSSSLVYFSSSLSPTSLIPVTLI